VVLREQHRLRVLRGMVGPKRDEVTGDWRELHNEELHNFRTSPSVIRMIESWNMRWTGHVAEIDREKKW
jgi:hypothetical protein